MIGRIASLIIMTSLVAACSGSIYRQRPVTGVEPVAITVDARQRVLLSQVDRKGQGANDPLFRRFCAEPSPDVFTVLGVSGSGSGNLGLGADKSVNAALQAAFSSTETGTTIARTQTLNTLREMMFRTCERYLSGAITSDEFPIIAARDQRIMVSILAIEQLTGAVTPRPIGISSGGSATTGMDSTQMVKLLAAGQEEIRLAEEEVAAKTNDVTKADAPGGACAALRKIKADGTPAWKAEDTPKLKACDDADAGLASAKAKRDVAQARYNDLVVASKKGQGISSASVEGTVKLGQEEGRKETVASVAGAVERIVASTFGQDETQLFCIRVLNPQASSGLNNDKLQQMCISYLIAQVRDERAQLARRLGMTEREFTSEYDVGAREAVRTQSWGEKLYLCASDPGRVSQFEAAVAAASVLDGKEDEFMRWVKAGATSAEERLRRAGPVEEGQIVGALAMACGLGVW